MNGPFTLAEFLVHLDSEKTFCEAMQKQQREINDEALARIEDGEK